MFQKTTIEKWQLTRPPDAMPLRTDLI